MKFSPNLLRLINVILRSATLASRFMLIFFLARFLPPAELGLYGLLTATISYAMYPVGLDFYTYATREIIKSDRNIWGGLLKNQIALTGILYIVFAPLMLLIFARGFLPWRVAGCFFLLLVLEHLAQEINRLLVAISEQLLASIVLFLRLGVWPLLVTVAMIFETNARDLTTVLFGWIISGVLACSLGLFYLHRMKMGGWRLAVDWMWIFRGVKVAIPLLVSSLALRGLFTVDRYWMSALTSLDVLGAYVLFMGLAGALASFLDAGVFVFIYPKLIGAFHGGKASEFRRGMRTLLMQTSGICVIYAVTALLTVDYLLHWLHRELYLEHQSLFPWLLLAMVLYSLGMVPHYGLYAQHRDRSIIRSHIAGALIFVLATWMLSRGWPILAVPLGLCCSFGFILIWKTIAYIISTRSNHVLSST